MIIFRTDANKNIATGHLMRTLTIAKECYNRSIPVGFVLADDKSEQILKKLCSNWENYQIEILNKKYDDLETELNDFTEFLAKEKPTSILIDSYYVTSHYLSEISKYARVCYLDDLNAFDYPVDIVINYCIDAGDLYPDQEIKKYLIGPEYAPLREQFRNRPYQVKEVVRDILITTGGTDEAGIAKKIVEISQATLGESVNLHILVGALNCYRMYFKELAAMHPNIIIYENYSEMADLMQKCDLAISAAGSTLYELCAIGVPTICFTIADNQIPNAKGLSAHEALIYAEKQDFDFHISELAADYPRRKKLSAKMRSLVDGYGASRIVDELLISAQITEHS